MNKSKKKQFYIIFIISYLINQANIAKFNICFNFMLKNWLKYI